MISLLLKRGPKFLGAILGRVLTWRVEQAYESLDQLRRSMSLRHCPNPAALERANSMKILQGWRV
jgi:dihydroorotate dehydrogenase (fumarate)